MSQRKNTNMGNETNELSQCIFTITKIIDTYFDEPLEMDRQLNNYYYKEGEKIEMLLESVSEASLPLNFLKGYLPVSNEAVALSNEDFGIVRTNLNKLASLEKMRFHQDKKTTIESKQFKDLIERIKLEKASAGTRQKSRFVFQKSKKRKIEMPEFPLDTKWSDIIIHFLNGQEARIEVKGFIRNTEYKAMGFEDEKTHKPNQQWVLLKLLSVKGGKLSRENNQDLESKKIDRVKKQKQLLSDTLKRYFQIRNDEPFYDYKKERAYKIKMALIPETASENSTGPNDAYTDMTPEVYEPDRPGKSSRE